MASRCEAGRWEPDLHRIGCNRRYNKMGLAEWSYLCHIKGPPHFFGPCELAKCSAIAKQASFHLPLSVRWTMWRGIRDREARRRVDTIPLIERLAKFIGHNVRRVWSHTQFVPVGGFLLRSLNIMRRDDSSGKPYLSLDRVRVTSCGYSFRSYTRHDIFLSLPRGWHRDEGRLSEQLGIFVLVREGAALVTVKVKAHNIKPLVRVWRYDDGQLSKVAQPEAAAILQRLTAFKNET